MCLNFDFYIIPLTLLLSFLKQYVICMLMSPQNLNPEEQVPSLVYLVLRHIYFNVKGGNFKLNYYSFCQQEGGDDEDEEDDDDEPAEKGKKVTTKKYKLHPLLPYLIFSLFPF